MTNKIVLVKYVPLAKFTQTTGRKIKSIAFVVGSKYLPQEGHEGLVVEWVGLVVEWLGLVVEAVKCFFVNCIFLL